MCGMLLAMSRSGRWEIPSDVVGAWDELYGEDVVREWLAEAEELAERCENLWQLRIKGFLPGGSLSCVLACRQANGTAAVLKLLAPWAQEAIGPEVLALSAWNGRGAVALLDHTPDGRALLLRRIRPGDVFEPSGHDEADCERVVQTLRVLASIPPPEGLPALSAAVRTRFARARGIARRRRGWITSQEINDAERRAVELAQTATRHGLVHGDAQNKNLLLDDAAGMLVAIDPEPSAGDRHFDPALWALTHRPGKGVQERCDALAGLLDLNADRLWCWCVVLAAPEVALDVAERAVAHREFLTRARPYRSRG